MGDTLWPKRLETVIKGNWSLLKTGLYMDGLADELIENNLITYDFWLDLKNRQVSAGSKVETYLGYITRFSEIKFTTFLTVLEKCEYNDIADILRKCLENTKENTTDIQSQDDDREINDLQQRNRELEDMVRNLEKAKVAAEEERQEELNKAQRINELMVQKETELGDLKLQLKVKDTTIETISSERNKTREEIERLRGKEQELQQEKNLQRELLAQLNKSKEALQQQTYLLKELETQLEKNEKDLQQEKISQNGLEVKLVQKEQDLQQEKNLREELTGQLKKTEQNLQQLNVKLHKTEADLKDETNKCLQKCLDKDAQLQTIKIELEKEKSKGLELVRFNKDLSDTLNTEREKIKKKKADLKERDNKREEKIVQIEHIRLGLEREKTILSETYEGKKSELVIENTKLSKELEYIRGKLKKKTDLLESEKQCRKDIESKHEESRNSMRTEMEEAFRRLQNDNDELRLKIARLEQDPATLPSQGLSDDAIREKIKELDETILMITARKKVLSSRLSSQSRISSICSIS